MWTLGDRRASAIRQARHDRDAEPARTVGTEAGGRECDARSRFCARKRSVAESADGATYARWRRHGKFMPAAGAKPLWARVVGRDGARLRRGGAGERVEESARHTA